MQKSNVVTAHPPLEAEEDETPTVKRIVEPNEEEPCEELDLEEAEAAEPDDPEGPNLFAYVGPNAEYRPFDLSDWVSPEDEDEDEDEDVTQELPPECLEELEEAAASLDVPPAPPTSGLTPLPWLMVLLTLLTLHPDKGEAAHSPASEDREGVPSLELTLPSPEPPSNPPALEPLEPPDPFKRRQHWKANVPSPFSWEVREWKGASTHASSDPRGGLRVQRPYMAGES